MIGSSAIFGAISDFDQLDGFTFRVGGWVDGYEWWLCLAALALTVFLVLKISIGRHPSSTLQASN